MVIPPQMAYVQFVTRWVLNDDISSKYQWQTLYIPLQDSLRKKQQPPVSSTPVSVPSPQPSPTFSPAIAAVTNTAQPTVQSLQQSHIDVKEVSIDAYLGTYI